MCGSEMAGRRGSWWSGREHTEGIDYIILGQNFLNLLTLVPGDVCVLTGLR
jgi:hypothetical protein